jgi:hypothetical protein
MVGLNTTWEWVVMLLVALGVGMIGGVGAAFIEGKAKVAAKPPETKHWFLDTTACIVLGGLAAVAVMYFFVPIKEVIPEDGSKPEVFYELIKLVPLSIIVGSAGTYFLQGFQKRIESAVVAQEGAQAVDSAQTVAAFALELPKQADNSLGRAAGDFQTTLTDAGVSPEQAKAAVPRLVEVAKDATAQGIQPHVDSIQVLAEEIAPPESIAARRQRILKARAPRFQIRRDDEPCKPDDPTT